MDRAHVTGLLRRHLPSTRFDSAETYLPLAAAAWTDCPGHELRRADGALLASATPRAGVPELSLSFLGPDRYADASEVAPGDAIASPGRDYRAKAARLQANPQYAGRVYGYGVRGSDGRMWLQYRWFFFLNDYRLLGRIPAGLHEGDWEMIQLRLDASGEVPDLALYLQHRSAQARAWEAVERDGERPVVYLARGSHGCYFTPGVRWTGAWFDRCDGRLPGPRETLEVVDVEDPAWDWIRWPGSWGATRPRAGLAGTLDGASPASPGAQVHIRWRDPAILLERVRG